MSSLQHTVLHIPYNNLLNISSSMTTVTQRWSPLTHRTMHMALKLQQLKRDRNTSPSYKCQHSTSTATTCHTLYCVSLHGQPCTALGTYKLELAESIHVANKEKWWDTSTSWIIISHKTVLWLRKTLEVEASHKLSSFLRPCSVTAHIIQCLSMSLYHSITGHLGNALAD